MYKEVIERLIQIESLLKNQANEIDRPLTLAETARYLDLSKSFVYKLTASGQLTHYKTGKRLYFLRADLRAYLLQHRVKPVDEIEEMAATHVALGQ